MMRGLGRSARKGVVLLLAALFVGSVGCGEDKPDVAGGGSSGSSGEGGGGGTGDDASIEDASDGDSAIDEQSGGAGGAGAGGEGASGGEGGSGAGGTGGDSGQGGESGSSGTSGEGGEGGEPAPDGGPLGDAGPQDAVCFGGGSASAADGTGACADPIAIDMSELDFGDAVFHRTGTEATNGLVPQIGKCAEGTGRDVVFNVKTDGTADLEISVDAEDDSDPIILVQDGPDTECDKSAATECIDDTGAGECEYLRVRVASGGYTENTPQVVIAETDASGLALTVRFRLIDPGGGS